MKCPEPNNLCYFCYNGECYATHWMVEKACKYLDKLIEVLNNYGHTLKKEHIIYGLKRAMQEK